MNWGRLQELIPRSFRRRPWLGRRASKSHEPCFKASRLTGSQAGPKRPGQSRLSLTLAPSGRRGRRLYRGLCGLSYPGFGLQFAPSRPRTECGTRLGTKLSVFVTFRGQAGRPASVEPHRGDLAFVVDVVITASEVMARLAALKPGASADKMLRAWVR